MTKFEDFIYPILEAYQKIIDQPSAEAVRDYVVNYLIGTGYFEFQPPDAITARIVLTKKGINLLRKIKEE